VSLGTGETITDRNFFNIPAATITGTVFSDFNVDGAKETNEPPIAGQTIFADSNNNGVLDVGEPFAISDAQGGYTLTGLKPGLINVRLVIPDNFRPVSPGNGVLSTQLHTGQTLLVDFGE